MVAVRRASPPRRNCSTAPFPPQRWCTRTTSRGTARSSAGPICWCAACSSPSGAGSRSVTVRRPGIERGRAGAIEVPAGLELVLIEGVGAGRRALAPHLDAVVWVQSDFGEAERRGIARDIVQGVNGDPEASTRFWHEWMAAELAFVEEQRQWERACVVVAGTPTRAHGSAEIVLAPPPMPGGRPASNPRSTGADERQVAVRVASSAAFLRELRRTCRCGKLEVGFPPWKVHRSARPPRKPAAALTDAEASRATLAHGIATPSWFFTSMGAAIATADRDDRGRPGRRRRRGSWRPAWRSSSPWPACSWRGSGGSTASGSAGFASRVVLGSGTAASAAYAIALGAAIWAAYDARWWLVTLCVDRRRRRVRAQRPPVDARLPRASPRSTGAGNRRRGWPCSRRRGHRRPGAAR